MQRKEERVRRRQGGGVGRGQTLRGKEEEKEEDKFHCMNLEVPIMVAVRNSYIIFSYISAKLHLKLLV